MEATATEEEFLEHGLNAGVDDVHVIDDGAVMFCSVELLGTSANALTARGLTVREQHIVYEPQTLVDCSSDAQQTIMLHKMLDVLDDNDDVQNVFHNADLPDEDE